MLLCSVEEDYSMNMKTTTRLSMLGRYCLVIGILAVSPGLTQAPTKGYWGSDQEDLPLPSERATHKQPVRTTIENEPEGMQELNLPSGVSGDWWGAVQEDIRQSEYNLTWQGQTYLQDVPAAYQAPNRAQGLRTYFTQEGIRCLLYTSPSPRDATLSRMPSSA